MIRLYSASSQTLQCKHRSSISNFFLLVERYVITMNCTSEIDKLKIHTVAVIGELCQLFVYICDRNVQKKRLYTTHAL